MDVLHFLGDTCAISMYEYKNIYYVFSHFGLRVAYRAILSMKMAQALFQTSFRLRK